MKYLYGNSLQSNIDQNYLEFTRLCLDFSVEVLLSESRIQKHREAIEAARNTAQTERTQVAAMAAKVRSLLDVATDGESTVIAVSLCESLRRACEAEVSRAEAAIETNLQTLTAQLDNQIQQERSAIIKRLEPVLQSCDFPDTQKWYAISIKPDGTYGGRLKSTSSNMFQFEMSLGIPNGNIFSEAIRVDALIPDLQIDLPDSGGWLKRSGAKIAPQKLSKEYITEVSQLPEGLLISLRNAPKEGQAGYDIIFAESGIRIFRISKQQEKSEPHKVEPKDEGALLRLYNTLTGAAEDVAKTRTSLDTALLDEQPLSLYPEPEQIVLWLLGHMAPVVQQISINTLTPSELVIKRILGDDRREEVFASKAELLERLSPLSGAHRAYFDCLGLDRDNRNMKGLPSPAPSKIKVTSPKEYAATVPMDILKPSKESAGGPKPIAVPAQAQSANPKGDNAPAIQIEESLELSVSDEPTSEIDLGEMDDESTMLFPAALNRPKSKASALPQRGSIPPVRPSSVPAARLSAAPPPLPPRPSVGPPAPKPSSLPAKKTAVPRESSAPASPPKK